MFAPRKLPNLLTVFRIIAVPVFALLWAMEGEIFRWINLGIYSLACFSDYLDGYLTRLNKNWASNFGKMLDPISDKIMVMAVLLLMVADRTVYGIHIVPAMLILIREIGVSGMREFLSSIRVKMPVTRLAKWKTASQMLALAFLIIGQHETWGMPTWSTGIVLLWISAGLTSITGLSYLHASWPHFYLDPLKERHYKVKKKSNKRK